MAISSNLHAGWGALSGPASRHAGRYSRIAAANLRKTRYQWFFFLYLCCMALAMVGYVYYDPYQVDGDAVSYMDLASTILQKRWHDVINGLWNPGYPAVLAFGKSLTHADRMHELQVFYWVNYFLFLFSLCCTAFFVQSVIRLRTAKTSHNSDETKWMLPNAILYLASYAIVFLSWEQEFSPGKIRVDGLFASLLLLGFGCLLRVVYSSSNVPAICAGVYFGLAYWVKSPGLTLGIVAFVLFIGYFYFESRLKEKRRQIFLAIVLFAVVVCPYVTALSLKKGRFDAGDSARLNYAWLVSDTQPLHLLNNEPDRFGHAVVHLKHPQIELLSNPAVVSFGHFPNATYAPWFDPSYFNEGVHPRFSLKLQVSAILNQSREVISFLVSHALVLAFFLVPIALGARFAHEKSLRRIVFVLYLFFVFSFVMYLLVHFLDRYVAGMFWLAVIATMGLLTAPTETRRATMKGAAIFMSVAILVAGMQNVARMRRAAMFDGAARGWQRTEEFAAAKQLRADIVPGSPVACFRACNTGAYWARLADVHVVSEIFDPRYISDMGNGSRMWQQLPNRARVLQALQTSGAKGLVGYFEEPPAEGEKWQALAGHYYWMPFSGR